ncbi:hypothetical protein ACS0TY_007300 [Phlomoides rotata]
MDSYVPEPLFQKWERIRKDFVVVYYYWKGLPEDVADGGFINYLKEQCPEFLNTLRKIVKHHRIKICAPKKITFFPPTLRNSKQVDMHVVLQEAMNVANTE